MVDSSTNVTRKDFTNEKQFVSLIARGLNFAQGKSRAAMITYGQSASVTFKFDSTRTLSEFQRLVGSATYLDGPGRPDQALIAAVDLFKDSRKTVNKVAILLTTLRKVSIANDKLLIDSSKQLRASGVKLYVIFVGRNDDNHDLQALVARPQNVIPVNSFPKLISLGPSIAREIAQGSGNR